MRHATSATTRAVVPGRGAARGRLLLSPGDVVASPETRLRYRIDRLLGEGGFGQVYLAERLGRSADVPAIVCIKVSTRIDGWLREAYFGQLLDGHPRAIRVYDTFPLIRPDGQRRSTASRSSTRATAICSAFLARTRQGLARDGPRGARSPGSSRCSASCTAARRCTATSRR